MGMSRFDPDPNWGGYRPGAGRPIAGETAQRHAVVVRLDEATYAKLLTICEALKLDKSKTLREIINNYAKSS